MEKVTFKPSLQTFEEEVLGELWNEPYLFETHTRESLQAVLDQRRERAREAANREAARL